MAKSPNKPIWLGRGYTPVHVVICLSAAAWAKATKGQKGVGDFPRDLDASCTHFPSRRGKGPFSIITVGPHIMRQGNQTTIMGLLCHEAVHVKQRCEEKMATTFDHETEAYLVQHIACAAWYEIEALINNVGAR